MKPKIIDKYCTKYLVDSPTESGEGMKDSLGTYGQMIIDCEFNIHHFANIEEYSSLLPRGNYSMFVESAKEANIIKEVTGKDFKEMVLFIIEPRIDDSQVQVYESKQKAKLNRYFKNENQLFKIFLFE